MCIFGAIDDVWINEQDELIVVDYKSTSVDKEITLDDEWKIVYKRQMEIYQWILRRDKRNHQQVSNFGYFVYCNGKGI
ncbi:MAG: PD-(D/E)XK nuclease family protein [Candidatus Aenigmarchaeota archaeon]|nr:PD-(D/E)XK nuclease family protein [Candidatus Aenigmarchaeota archaeon]